MYKYIFSDLDMTLLQDDKTISSENKEAILKAKDKGVKFMFSTGRIPFTFERYKEDVDISSYSACNGSILMLDGKLIKDVYFDSKLVKKLAKYGIEHKLNERIFTRDNLYIVNFDDSAQMPLRYPGTIDITSESVDELIENNKIYKIAYHTADVSKLKQAQKEILDSGLEVEAVFSNPIFLEFGMLGQNKGQGILDFCELTGAKPEEIITLGDNENDFSMMNGISGLSACPINAIDKIKEVSNVVSDLTNNEGFVASIIEEYILKNSK